MEIEGLLFIFIARPDLRMRLSKNVVGVGASTGRGDGGVLYRLPLCPSSMSGFFARFGCRCCLEGP